MPVLKRIRVPERCPKCSGTFDKYGRKAHECYPARDRDEPPENRPELTYRTDLRAALSPNREDKDTAPPITARGTATVGILLPEIEPERIERPVKKRKSKTKQQDLSQAPIAPEPETRYESPKDARDMDHTKDFAHAYREEGKFGSHPSYDGFDDESKP